jgi:hypothetical protein
LPDFGAINVEIGNSRFRLALAVTSSYRNVVIDSTSRRSGVMGTVMENAPVALRS